MFMQYIIKMNSYLLCILRKISFNNSNVLRFVDYIGSNENFIHLNNFLMFLITKCNAEYLDFYSYGIPEKNILKAGFINRYRTAGLIVPNYFEPFEMKNVDLNFAFKFSNKYTKVRLFKADSDQDRPNKI